MAEKPIQELFGARVIESFADFARADLKPVDDLIKHEFAHVADKHLRESLAQVFYGTRWIYKLGLALLTRDEERAAHIRAQLVDYGSVCEGLLAYCIGRAIKGGYAKGQSYLWKDPDKQKRPIAWNQAAPEAMLLNVSLWWLIRVAAEFGVVKSGLESDLHWVREQRNSVHLRQAGTIGRTAYLNQSKRSFTTTVETVRQTKLWIAGHP